MATTPQETTTRVVAELSSRIETCLEQALRGTRTVAYVNYPNHGNAGDPALWLGGLRVFQRLGIRVSYHCAPDTYDPHQLARTDPDAIVINGGGNLGDRYPRQQQGREAVLRDFATLRTVQLPQSIAFSDPTALARMQQLVTRHRDLTILLRDEQSLKRAREWFDAPVRRCPDLAFALGTRPRTDRPRHELLWLARDDQESTGHRLELEDLDAEVTDWLGTITDEPAWSRRARTARWIDRTLASGVRGGKATSRWRQRITAPTYRQLAEARVLRGMRILARGRVVVTDRLHGHVLSLLQGIPHVVLDNIDGKVRSLFDTDTHRCPIAHFAKDPDEATELARALLAQR